ncbi:hypothetical protein JCM10207_003699 [Rhodosporidiobolus poonsookiae]
MSDAAREEEQPLLGDSAGPGTEPTPSFSTRVGSALRNPKRLNGLEKALAALAIALLLLSAVLGGVLAGKTIQYDRFRRRHSADPHPHPHPTATATITATQTVPGPTSTTVPPPKNPDPPGDNDEVCLTSSCVKSAAKILSSLDPDVNPCDDFYEFANGGWLASNRIPAGRSAWGTFNIVDNDNKRIIRDIIDAERDTSLPLADQTNLAHLRSFWASCIDEDAIEKQGAKPLLDVVAEVVDFWRGEKVHGLEDVNGGLVLQLDNTLAHKKHKKGDSKWDPKTKRERLTHALSFLHSRGITSLFAGYTEGNVGGDPGTNVLWLSQSGLSLPSKDYYGDKEIVKVYREVAEKIIAELYKSTRDHVNSADLAAGVVELEKKIARVSLDAEDLDLPFETYNPKNASELQALFPSISFANYFSSYTPRPRYPDPVIVTSPEFFTNLTRIVDATAPDVLEAYFVLQTALEFGELLGTKQPIRQQVDRLSNFLLGVAPDERKPRDEICLQSALDNYGFLVGRYYAQRAFPGESKAYAEEIIHAIIDAFGSRLPSRSWLDAETRKKAQEKVDAIQVKIGYPKSPDTEDPASIERYYALQLPVESDDFFGNVLRSRVADERRKWVKVGRPVDRGEWDMVPSEVNAYYQPSANEIAFPAGILQPPFFSVDWPDYLNFGSFGGVSGHELTHSLDQAGRLYDKDGQLVNWWSQETNARFLERQRCFQDQYRNYTIVGPDGKEYPVNSRLTGGEDGADAGGIAQSFTAWKQRLASDPHGKTYRNHILPGLQQYSREQLFFIASAQGWARAVTQAEALRRIRTDPHSPNQYRVIGPLSNNADFAKAFNCPVGSVMNRGDDKRCEIW